MCCFHQNSNYSLKDFLEPGATHLVPAATVGHGLGFHLQLTGSGLFPVYTAGLQAVCSKVCHSMVPIHCEIEGAEQNRCFV